MLPRTASVARIGKGLCFTLGLLIVAAPDNGAAQGKADRNGDALPAGALARLGTLRWRHADAVTFVAFLPDGKAVLTGGLDRTLRLWDRHSGKELRRFTLPAGKPADQPAMGGNGVIMLARLRGGQPAPALSPDGKTLAAAVPGNKILLWDIASGKEIRRLDGPRPGWLVSRGRPTASAWPCAARTGRLTSSILRPPSNSAASRKTSSRGSRSPRFSARRGSATPAGSPSLPTARPSPARKRAATPTSSPPNSCASSRPTPASRSAGSTCKPTTASSPSPTRPTASSSPMPTARRSISVTRIPARKSTRSRPPPASARSCSPQTANRWRRRAWPAASRCGTPLPARRFTASASRRRATEVRHLPGGSRGAIRASSRFRPTARRWPAARATPFDSTTPPAPRKRRATPAIARPSPPSTYRPTARRSCRAVRTA